MQTNDAFRPAYNQAGGGTAGTLYPSVTIAASTVAASAVLPLGTALGGYLQIQIANQTASWAYVNFGVTTAGITAATAASSYPVAPGAVVVVTIDYMIDTASVILATGTGSVTFTRGMGL